MNFKQMQDNVMYRLDNTDTNLRTHVKDWLNEAQDEFCNAADFFFMEADKTYTTTADQANESLPSNFSKVHTIWQTETPSELVYCNVHRFRESYPNPTTTGKSLLYRMFSGELHFYPIPDAAFSIYMRYYKIPTAMSADGDTGDVPARWQAALKYYALGQGKYQDDEPHDGDRFMAKFEEQVGKAMIYYQRQENETLRLESKDSSGSGNFYTNSYPISGA